MAGTAEGRLRFDEQVRLGGTVGQVAGPAPVLGQNLMNDLVLVLFLFMAGIADLLPLRLKETRRLGSVGIMAGYAIAFLEGGMNIGFVQPELRLAMAGIADLVPYFFQDQLRHDAVTQVATLALACLHVLMHVSHRKIFVGEFLVTVQTPFPLESSLLRPRNSVRDGARRRKNEGGDEEIEDPAP
jgi:hypothetical protein